MKYMWMNIFFVQFQIKPRIQEEVSIENIKSIFKKKKTKSNNIVLCIITVIVNINL